MAQHCLKTGTIQALRGCVQNHLARKNVYYGVPLILKMLTKMKLGGLLLAIFGCSFSACSQKQKPVTDTVKSVQKQTPSKKATMDKKLDTITLGAGCFWCVEAVFQQLKGVEKVVSGYSGGHVENPTYEEVCDKTTGHAEVCQLYYDPTVVTVDEILEVYWQTHDPTTMNQQGADKGPQYRSVIFYHNAEQKEKSEKYKAELDKSGAFSAPVVTAIESYKNFYAAEANHQNYYRSNPNQGYCYYVIRPKLEKFEKVFKDKMKKE
jgi:peptide-methionine (S)-S-oxide reductase